MALAAHFGHVRLVGLGAPDLAKVAIDRDLLLLARKGALAVLVGVAQGKDLRMEL